MANKALIEALTKMNEANLVREQKQNVIGTCSCKMNMVTLEKSGSKHLSQYGSSVQTTMLTRFVSNFRVEPRSQCENISHQDPKTI